MVTLVPPTVGPDAGEIDVTVGAGTMYVNCAALLVPLGVVTVTFTVPEPAGVTAVIDVAELTVKLAASAAPNVTAVAPVKFVPVIGPSILETGVRKSVFRFSQGEICVFVMCNSRIRLLTAYNKSAFT